MKKLSFFILALMLFSPSLWAAAGFNDIRGYIDGSSYYACDDTLDAATDYSDSVWVVGAQWILFEAECDTITTSEVFRIEGSVDGSHWTNVSGDKTFTLEGTWGISFDQAVLYRYYRAYWVSETGATNGTVVGRWRVGGRVNANR